jgi:hypothetical protein
VLLLLLVLYAKTDSHYSMDYALKTAEKDMFKLPENASHAELTAHNAINLIPKNAWFVTHPMSSTKDNAYQNAHLDTSTTMDNADLA